MSAKTTTVSMIADGKNELFKRHVELIRRMDGATENEAKMRAWLEGERGLHNRLRDGRS